MKSKKIRLVCLFVFFLLFAQIVFSSCGSAEEGSGSSAVLSESSEEASEAVSESEESDFQEESSKSQDVFSELPGGVSEMESDGEEIPDEQSDGSEEPTPGESIGETGSGTDVSDEPIEEPEPTQDQKKLFEKMPVLVINTKDGAEIVSRDDYVTCQISSSNCPDEYIFEESAGGIRVRGNASSNYGDVEWIRRHKVHYRIKFDSKQNLFGLNDGAKCKSWVLMRGDNNYAEEQIPFFLFRRMSGGKYYSSDYTFVRVILNGDDIGVYVLCEQNQINKHRVDIDEQKNGETYLNTGYFMELENYPAREPYVFRIDYGGLPLTDPYGVTRTPRVANVSVKNDTMTEEQMRFLSKWTNNIYILCYRAIVKGEYCRIDENGTLVRDYTIRSARECIERYVALDAFVWTYLLEEFALELDVGVGSFFFYLDLSVEQPKLTFCAPWDYSWAFLNQYGFRYDMMGVGAWQPQQFVDYAGDRSNPWFVLFYSADWFREEVCREWKRIRGEGIFEDLFEEMRLVSELYREDFAYTSKRWNAPEQEAESQKLIDWMTNRVRYLDKLWGQGNGLPPMPEKRENVAGKATYEIHDFFRFGNGYQYSESGEIVYGDDGNDLTDGKHASSNFHDAGWVGMNAAHPNAKENGQYVLFAFDRAYAIRDIYVSVSNLCSAGIYAPEGLEVFWSQDGKTWNADGATGDYTAELIAGTSAEYQVSVNQTAKYWKIVIHFGEGGWCFMDEIEFVPQKAAS